MRIVVDSGCDLPQQLQEKFGAQFHSVPLSMIVDGVTFVDQNLNLDEYIAAFEASANSPVTAAPSPQSFMDQFGPAEENFVVTLSHGISGSHSNACIAKELFAEQNKSFVHVFDSLSATIGESLIALKIAESIKEKMSAQHIVEHVNQFIAGMKTYFLVENFDTIVKNGRMKPYVAKLASMLHIRVIGGVSDGKMDVVGKAIGYKNCVSKLIDLILEEGRDFDQRILGITHVKCLEKAEALRDEILARIHFKDAIIYPIGGICTTYAARGGMVVSF
jgi:DegV family protein with EDD domain